MIRAYPLKKSRKWQSLFLLFLGLYIVFTSDLTDSRYLIGAAVFLTIGTWQEKIFIDKDGILYKSRLLLVFKMNTVCSFSDADKLELVPFNDEYFMLQHLKGRKLKRVLVESKNKDCVKVFIGPYNK